MTKAIYQAEPRNKLRSVIEQAQWCLDALRWDVGMFTKPELHPEGLKPGEMAFGDWIVRPRFTEKDTSPDTA